MANSKTVLFPIDIPYKAPDDTVQLRKYVLTLSLSMVAEGADGCGEISINGAVMPVDDQPLAVKPVDEAPLGVDGAKQGDEMQQAA